MFNDLKERGTGKNTRSVNELLNSTIFSSFSKNRYAIGLVKTNGIEGFLTLKISNEIEFV